MSYAKQYKIGDEFTKEQFQKWENQLVWWVADTMPRIPNPKEHVKKVLLASLNGTKLDGSPRPNSPDDFFKRVRQFVGFDLETGVGLNRRGGRPKKHTPSEPKTKKEDLPPVDVNEYLHKQEEYKKELLVKYPHLESDVYQPKVDELAETIMKSRMLSRDFITATGAPLERLNKIRESLHKQIKELMEFLEISPKLLMAKQKESESGDVSSLIAKMEKYGEDWEEYERLDALRELLQLYHQLHSKRPDGSPQLNDWELWHLTRTRPIKFKCKCGEEYTLIEGFKPEEIEAALEQAYEVYGFGLEPIGISETDAVADEELIDEVIIDESIEEG